MKMGHLIGLLLLFGVLPSSAPPARAQGKIFKCVNAGHTVYQQVPCPDNAPGDIVPGAEEPAPVSHLPAAHRAARPNAPVASSAASSLNVTHAAAEEAAASRAGKH